MEIYELTAHEIKEKIEKREITITEVCKSFLKRIDEKEKDVKAFITLCDKETILENANIADEKLQKGEKVSDFLGMPIGIKDNICTKGMKTTAGSKMLENFNSPYNATTIENINNENMIIFGKTNMDEFGMGTSTENSAFFNTKNPWDLSKVPGGSSGGSAAAVSADMTPWALGSDTGGSIRQPSGFCGIVGLKPTYGLVSRYGLIAYASSLEQIGTLTKDVEDAAMLLNVIVGHDENDSTSAKVEKKDYTESLVNDVKGLKIGVPKEFFGEGINEEVKTAVLNATKKFEELGAIVDECSLDIAESALSAYYIIACAEASSNLGRFDGIRYGYRTKNFKSLKDIYRNSRSEGFGKEVKRRIMLGTYVLSSGYYDAYYKKAVKVRTLVRKAFLENLKNYDVLLIPASPIPTFKIGEKNSNPLEMYLADICTVSINVAGVPAISIPCGLDNSGMPIGMQLIGNHFREDTIIQAAYTYEQNTKFREKYRPTFKGGDK